MQKAFFTLYFLCGFFAAAFSQEQAISSQYQLFPVMVNPAYTGARDEHELIVNARSSWAGFTGAPSTFNMLYNGPVGDKLALGAGLFADNQGNQNTLRFQGNYAFRFRLQKAQIGIGLSTEFLRQQARVSLLNNPLVDPNDPVVEEAVNGRQIFDATMGVNVLYDDRFFVSLAVPNAVRARLDVVPGASDETEQSRLFEHYVFQLGYIVNVVNQNFKIVPNITLRNIRDTPYQIDLNVQTRFMNDRLIAGLTYRPNDRGAMVFQLGSRINQIQLAYSFDVSFSRFQQYNAGSHELSVAFQLPRKGAKPAPPTEGN
jgi:type IX secretion system PorP/SprF family membrane protein